MRKVSFISLLIVAGFVFSAPLLTLKLIDEPFNNAVKLISEKAGVKIIVIDPIDRKVSLEANKASLPDVLKSLTSQVSAQLEEGYLITTNKSKKSSTLGGPLITISFPKGTQLSEAFKRLSEVSKVKILLNPDVKGETNELEFKNQKLERIINRLCSSAGLYWEKVYIISKPNILVNLEDFAALFGNEQNQQESPQATDPRQRFMENYQRFMQMSPEERVDLMSNLFDRLFSLPADQRDRIIQGVAVFLSNAVNAFLSLPPDRQSRMANFFEPIIRAGAAAYFRLPPDKRQMLQPWADAFAPLENYRPPR
ncbi:hypothetical protein H5T87_00215 [bacterium]|nr:hypothetical protein [bacterium]